MMRLRLRPYSTLSSFSSSSSCCCSNSCNNIRTLKQTHAQLVVSQSHHHHHHHHHQIILDLFNLYVRFGDLKSSLSVLDSFQEPFTPKLWNLTIKSSLAFGHFQLALFIFKKMRRFAVGLDCFTLPLINQLYFMLASDFRCGTMMHCLGIHFGFGKHVYFCNTLIDLYTKCGSRFLDYARSVFDEMPLRDHVTWTSMIAGYVALGDSMRAFSLFYEMTRQRHVEPNFVTLITMLKASCGCSSDVDLGKGLHGYMVKKGFLMDKSVKNSLLRMYTCKGTSFDVETIFQEFDTDVVSWNTLISYYVLVASRDQVVKTFQAMMKQVRPSVESVTLIASALSKFGNLSSQAQQLHGLAIKTSLSDNIFLTCLMGLYSKCTDLDACLRLFNEVPARNRNTLTWSTLMSAFTENRQYNKTVEMFKQLRTSGAETTAEIITSLLDVCINTQALHMGKEIHGYCIRNLLNTSGNNSVVETSILNMYLKCGSIISARHSFGTMADKDVVAWTSMIEGLGIYGLGRESLTHFDQMLKAGINPNDVTFLSILSACSHSGLTNEGCELLYAMKWKFGLEPELNHYTCIVDLLGRSGKVKDALALILKMVACPDSRIWGALLAGCRLYMDRKIGEFAGKRLLELEPDNMGYQIVFSNMQAGAEKWTDVERLRMGVSELNLAKLPGWSCIDVR